MKIKNYIILVIILLFNLLIVSQVFANNKNIYNSVDNEIIDVKYIYFDIKNLTLFKSDQSVYLHHLNIIPPDATNQNYTLTSSNNDVLTIKENGLIIPISIGETTVVAKTYDGEHSNYCNITILDNPPTEFNELQLRTCLKGKIWTIIFNKKITSNINELSKKMYITDETGNYIQTRLEIKDSWVRIYPLYDYKPDKKYFIYILKGIKGGYNTTFKNNNRMTFITEH